MNHHHKWNNNDDDEERRNGTRNGNKNEQRRHITTTWRDHRYEHNYHGQQHQNAAIRTRSRSRDNNERRYGHHPLIVQRLNPKEINKKITACRNLEELVNLLMDEVLIAEMDTINVATVIHRMGRLRNQCQFRVVPLASDVFHRIIMKMSKIKFDSLEQRTFFTELLPDDLTN
jgi:hypothetical protein